MEHVQKAMEAYKAFWNFTIDAFIKHFDELMVTTSVMFGIIAVVLFLHAMVKLREQNLRYGRWRIRARARRMGEKCENTKEKMIVADAITHAFDELHLAGVMSYRRKMWWFKRMGHMMNLPDLVPRAWPRKESKQARAARLKKLKDELKIKHPNYKPKEAPTQKPKLSLVKRTAA